MRKLATACLIAVSILQTLAGCRDVTTTSTDRSGGEPARTTTPPTDITAPAVTAFTMPATATSLTVSVNSFTAMDNVAVTGYLITESPSTPAASAAGWSTSAPTTFTFSISGARTAYAWAKDAAGNISTPLSATVAIIGIIFEDNFDSHTDWNADSEYNGTICSAPCASVPAGWDGYRAVPSAGASGAPQIHTGPVVSIQTPLGSLPDHSGTGAGKALIIYQESDLPDEGSVWKGDGQLAKILNQQYAELYIRYWLRTQADWQQVTTAGSMMKTFRVTHTSDKTNLFLQTNNTPTLYIDLGGASWGVPVGRGDLFPAYRCNASPSDYYCVNAGNAYENGNSYGDDKLLPPMGAPVSNFADGNWHRYDVHVRTNDLGSKNGVMSISYDGVSVVTHNDMVWLEPGATATGFDTVFLGGNSHNNYTQNANQWYAIDDLVISTTPIPDNYVIGESYAPARFQ